MTSSLRTIAGHRLVAGLGHGGMARVYLAISQKPLGFTKLVVLKVLREELDVDGDLLEMFIQEARLAARLNHLHVVQTYEAGEDDGRHYIAMEYLEGQALSSVITRAGAGFSLEARLRILCDALHGLQYVHDLTDYDGTPLGLVHRDVSPQNVFVTYTGQAKIIDFGIAKSFDSTRTVNGILKGKTGYMAPEQARTGAVPDRRTDVFAVGVMLWEALAGRRFVARGVDEVVALARRIAGQDPRIRDVVPDAPPALADICDKALAHAPADRYASANEMREAIEACLRERAPCDAAQIAHLLEETFADERARIRRLVDEQVRKAFHSRPLIDLHSDGSVTPPRGSRADFVEIRADHADRALDGAAATRFQPTETGATLAAPVIPVVAAPRWRAALTWAGSFALAALATSLVIQRIDRATGHAELAPPAIVAAPAAPERAPFLLPEASAPLVEPAASVLPASTPSARLAASARPVVRGPLARPAASAPPPPRATRVEPSATARELEPNRLRPLDGNPWETPK